MLSVNIIIAQEMRLEHSTCLKIESGSTVDISNGDIVLESDSDGDASVVNFGTISFSGGGQAEIQRYQVGSTDNLHGWHFLSTPVSDQNIQPTFVSNPPSAGIDFYKWDEVSATWINTKDGEATWNSGFESAFVVGQGYLVASSVSQTKSFEGSLNNSNVSKSGLTHTGSGSYSGWHLLGNPFPCALKWNETTGGAGWNLNNIDGVAKIWNETTASYSDVSSGGIIPAMQGFMVHVTTTGTGSLTIPTVDKTYSATSWYKNDFTNGICLSVSDKGKNTTQTCIIKVDPNATTGFDPQFDSRFLPGYAPEIYAFAGNTILSTSTIPELSNGLEIPIGFTKNSFSEFYLKIEGIDNLPSIEEVYLFDMKNHYVQKLSDNPVYHFSSEDEDDIIRFKLHFGQPGNNEFDNGTNVFTVNGNIVVSFKFSSILKK